MLLRHFVPKHSLIFQEGCRNPDLLTSTPLEEKQKMKTISKVKSSNLMKVGSINFDKYFKKITEKKAVRGK